MSHCLTSQEVYKKVTDHILASLESNKIPWRKPWCTAMPQNVNSRLYGRLNTFLLLSSNHSDPRFVTYKRANELGGRVRKGEKGTPIISYYTYPEDDDPDSLVFVSRINYVFNVAQCEGLDLSPYYSGCKSGKIESAELVVSSYTDHPEILEGGNKACYNFETDIIRMPQMGQFNGVDSYYSTLFHELAHSTGHKNRLNRHFGQKFGDDKYAYEELVAELTAAYLCAICGIDNSVQLGENHISYIQSWSKQLVSDPELYLTAARKAQKAADFITENLDMPEIDITDNLAA